MTSPDQRYAGGCVDWTRYDVPTLAGFLDADLSTSWAQVSAWWQARDLTAQHVTVMRQARESIAEAWPPNVNEAAALYLAQVDALIAAMEDMVVAAEANARALTGILTVLTDAKRQVDDLHEQWHSVPDSLWDQAVTVASAPMPAVGFADARAVAGQKAALNAKAQDVMRKTDQSTYEYLPQLLIPAGRGFGEPAPSPLLPPGSGGVGPSGSPPRGVLVRKPSIPSASPPAVVHTPNTNENPVLAGQSLPTAQPSPAPVVGRVLPRPPGGAPVPDVPPPSMWVQTPAGRVLRSGAVLGAPPEAWEPPTQPRPGAPTAGLEPTATAGPASEPGAEAALWGAGMGGVPQSGQRQIRRMVPPDTEWPVRKGVPPVIEPGPEPIHDPGPGVIGIDR